MPKKYYLLILLSALLFVSGCSKYDTSQGCSNYDLSSLEFVDCAQQMEDEQNKNMYDVKSCNKLGEGFSELCEQIKLTNMAIRDKNILACDDIKTQNYKWQCYNDYSKVTQDVDGCLSISLETDTSTYYRDECIFNISLEQKDIKICQKITNEIYPYSGSTEGYNTENYTLGTEYCIEEVEKLLANT